MSSWGALLRRGHLGTEADRATFRTLHTASLASPPLRTGLNATSAERSLTNAIAILRELFPGHWRQGGQKPELPKLPA